MTLVLVSTENIRASGGSFVESGLRVHDEGLRAWGQAREDKRPLIARENHKEKLAVHSNSPQRRKHALGAVPALSRSSSLHLKVFSPLLTTLFH